MYGYDQTAYGGHHPDPYLHGQHAHTQHAYGSHHQPPVAGYGGEQQSAYAQPTYTQPQQQAAAPLTLLDALRAYTSASLSTEEFQDIFWSAKVYCPRGEAPGFLAVQTTQEPVIPLFTSLRELRNYAGKESRYFTVTGGEVLDLLPDGYGFALDMEGEHRLVLDSRAVHEMVEYAMRRVYG